MDADRTSYRVDHLSVDTCGFAEGYEFRRHRNEDKSNKGAYQAREDWEYYIGPVDRWGSCNPYEGNFGAVVLPLCRPDRLWMVSYLIEFAFMYDGFIEMMDEATVDAATCEHILGDNTQSLVTFVAATEHLKKKMMENLMAIDPLAAQSVEDCYAAVIKTTLQKQRQGSFDTIDEYLEYRIVDVGAVFTDTVMRFGMGLTLTQEEEAVVAPIIRPCYAALGLENDYFSFDTEYLQLKKGVNTAMTNAVWLYMQWKNVGVVEAKEIVKEQTKKLEQEFLESTRLIAHSNSRYSSNVKQYLQGLRYMVSGNVSWSIRCPRYRPELRRDAGERLKVSETCTKEVTIDIT